VLFLHRRRERVAGRERIRAGQAVAFDVDGTVGAARERLTNDPTRAEPAEQTKLAAVLSLNGTSTLASGSFIKLAS
jgi:hypothetical protein